MIRGEAYIPYSTFININEKIPETENRYKNPRNLASGTVRQLDSKIAAERNVCFAAFELVTYTNEELKHSRFDPNLFADHFEWMKELGIHVVNYKKVTSETIEETIAAYEKEVKNNDFPSDGLVLMYNDVKFGKSLGTTGKYPRYGIAFKWADELAETTVRKVEWNTSRTGLINPVAVFDPVELEGTEVKRAAVHNVSVLRKLKIAPGSVISVYKANMIIPTIAENLKPSGKVIIPERCPACNETTELHVSEDGIETLYCRNDHCPAKHIKSFVHFTKRDSMNIEGLNESTLQKLIEAGFVHDLKDIFSLKDKEEEISELEGMGRKSTSILLNNIENARRTTLERVLSGLGIPLIGRSASKELSKAFNGDWNTFLDAYKKGYDFKSIPDFGRKMKDSLISYLNENEKALRELFSILKIEKENTDDVLLGKTFVITGSVTHFKDRDELKSMIESLGGKVNGSVSANTSYLINNDINSGSGKNKKAKELGIPIITEDNFLKLIG